ncbi:hypothetical protein JCM10213v2_004752 [Rhodosporidiobolus nylandii]
MLWRGIRPGSSHTLSASTSRQLLSPTASASRPFRRASAASPASTAERKPAKKRRIRVDSTSTYTASSSSDTDVEVLPPSPADRLAAFLSTLSPSFHLASHAGLVRSRELGISTPEELLEIAQADVDGLLKLLGEKGVEWAARTALRRGLEAENRTLKKGNGGAEEK